MAKRHEDLSPELIEMLDNSRWACLICREFIDVPNEPAARVIKEFIMYKAHVKCLEKQIQKYHEQTGKQPVVLMPEKVWEDEQFEDVMVEVNRFMVAKKPFPGLVEEYTKQVQGGKDGEKSTDKEQEKTADGNA